MTGSVRKLCTLSLICAVYAAAAEPRNQELDGQVKEVIATANAGHVSLYAKNLQTGASYSLSGADAVRTASTIKLGIMAACFAEAADGKISLAEPIELLSEEKVSGSGILQELSSGVKLPLRDVIDLMIVLSDNTATNLILNRVGANTVNARLNSWGLTQTRAMRKILGDGNHLKPVPTGISTEGTKPENKRWGIGRSSPYEMVVLLEKLYRGELVNKQASDEMLAILKHQRDRNGIGRDLQDIDIASKSGALDHLRSDVGIVFSKGGPIAMAITVEDIPRVNWTADNPGLLEIARLSEVLLAGLNSGH